MIKTRKLSKRILSKIKTARFCGQLKMLLAAGIPVFEALGILKNLFPGQGIDAAVEKVADGQPLAKALENFLPAMVIGSIEIAEQAGNLEQVLGQLQKYYEHSAEVEEKVKSALVYPAFVVSLCVLCVGVMFVVVLPGFKGLFSDLGTDLPLFSQIIMGLGEAVSNFWYLPVLLGLISYAGMVKYRRTSYGAQNIDAKLLKIRFLGQQQTIEFFRTLGSMLNAGVPVLSAMSSTAKVSSNKAFQKIILIIQNGLEHGEKLSDLLLKHQVFPKQAIQMLVVGESSGQLGEMLINIAQFYEQERENMLKRFTGLLEPVLTLVVGVIVGLVVMAMFLPMISIMSHLE